MRAIIIGLGGTGAMAAWRLARLGHEVVGLEQFALNHDYGSSYGDSRIVRRVYPDPLYTGLMADAYALWEMIQSHTSEELFRRAGGVFCGPTDHPQVVAAQRALAESRVEHYVLQPEEAMCRFPAFVLQPNEVAIYEPSMGYARASRCVRMAAQLARQEGAEIRENCRVVGLEGAKRKLTVRLADGEVLTGDRVLLTVGAWARPFLASVGVDVPLVVSRQPYVHLLPRSGSESRFEVGQFPVWIDASANAYGFPRLGEVGGVKYGLHDRGATVTPETVDRTVQPEDTEAALRYAAHRFPELTPTVAYSKVCLYTNTPDEDFIVDAVPGLAGAFVVSGCSGHGFKFTPLLGEISARLLTDTPVGYDLSRFRLSRFA